MTLMDVSRNDYIIIIIMIIIIVNAAVIIPPTVSYTICQTCQACLASYRKCWM